MSSSLRARLTLWYVSAFSLVLIGFSAGVYFFVEGILLERMDSNLRLTLQMTSSALARHLAGGPSLAFRELGQVGYSSVAEVLDDPRFPGQIIAVLDSNGRVLARRPVSSALVFRFPARHLQTGPPSVGEEHSVNITAPHPRNLPLRRPAGCRGTSLPRRQAAHLRLR